MTIKQTPGGRLDLDDQRTSAPRRARGLVGATAAIGLVLGLAACGQSGGPRAQAAESPSPTTAGDGNRLVLRVTLGDGGTAHLPLLSPRADPGDPPQGQDVVGDSGVCVGHRDHQRHDADVLVAHDPRTGIDRGALGGESQRDPRIGPPQRPPGPGGPRAGRGAAPVPRPPPTAPLS